MNIVTSLLSGVGLGLGAQPPSYVPSSDDPSPQHPGDFGESRIYHAATDCASPRQHAGRSASTPASTYEDAAIQNLRAERELKLLMDARREKYVRLTELAAEEKRTSAFQSKTQMAAYAERREKLQYAAAVLDHKIGDSLLCVCSSFCLPVSGMRPRELTA